MKKILFILTMILATATAGARQPGKGYRGFLDWSSSVRSDRFGFINIDGSFETYRDNTFYTGFSTSHGYQINPIFFVGAGLGMERCGEWDSWIAPVFMQGRADFLFGKFTPFGDLRIGYNVANGGGVYVSPTVGYRFNWARKMGVNLGLGMSIAGYTSEVYEGTQTAPDSYEIQYVGKKHGSLVFFTFRVGIDF